MSFFSSHMSELFFKSFINHNFVVVANHQTKLTTDTKLSYTKQTWVKSFKYMKSCVSFIPYFCLLVFGILVTLVAWCSFCFFLSCPSCLAKCKQRLRDIFVFSELCCQKSPKMKNGMNKTFMTTLFFLTFSRVPVDYLLPFVDGSSFDPMTWITATAINN